MGEYTPTAKAGVLPATIMKKWLNQFAHNNETLFGREEGGAGDEGNLRGVGGVHDPDIGWVDDFDFGNLVVMSFAIPADCKLASRRDFVEVVKCVFHRRLVEPTMTEDNSIASLVRP